MAEHKKLVEGAAAALAATAVLWGTKNALEANAAARTFEAVTESGLSTVDRAASLPKFAEAADSEFMATRTNILMEPEKVPVAFRNGVYDWKNFGLLDDEGSLSIRETNGLKVLHLDGSIPSNAKLTLSDFATGEKHEITGLFGRRIGQGQRLSEVALPANGRLELMEFGGFTGQFHNLIFGTPKFFAELTEHAKLAAALQA